MSTRWFPMSSSPQKSFWHDRVKEILHSLTSLSKLWGVQLCDQYNNSWHSRTGWRFVDTGSLWIRPIVISRTEPNQHAGRFWLHCAKCILYITVTVKMEVRVSRFPINCHTVVVVLFHKYLRYYNNNNNVIVMYTLRSPCVHQRISFWHHAFLYFIWSSFPV